MKSLLLIALLPSLLGAQEKSPFQPKAPDGFAKRVADCLGGLEKAGVTNANAVGPRGSFYVVSQNDPDGHPGDTLYYYRRKGAELELYTALLRGRASTRGPIAVAIPGGPRLSIEVRIGAGPGHSLQYLAREASAAGGNAITAAKVELDKPFAKDTAIEYVGALLGDGIAVPLGEVGAPFSDIRLLYPDEATARQTVAAHAKRLRDGAPRIAAALDACAPLGEGKSSGTSLFKLNVDNARQSLRKFLATPAAPAKTDSH